MNSKKVDKLTYDRLKEVLFYDQNTGIFLWKYSKQSRFVGEIAGSKNNKGYRSISIDGVLYKEHRLAWFYVYGKWPENEIDHINRIKIDNKISNLREVTKSQNRQNINVKKNNKSGCRGVSWHKTHKRWGARIGIDKKFYHLGYFDTKEEAYKAYLDAAARLHTHNPVVS